MSEPSPFDFSALDAAAAAPEDVDDELVKASLYSFVQPLGYSASACGYCSEVPGRRSRGKTSLSYGFWAISLTPVAYRDLINRGWRRSGKYVYKPDMLRTCCPQYTIRLRASEFKPSKTQRNLLNRFSRYVNHGVREGEPGWPGESAAPWRDAPKKTKGRHNATDLHTLVHAAEAPRSRHRLTVEYTPSTYTAEKYALFALYQTQVHMEPPDKVTKSGFVRFLVDTPLEDTYSNSLPGFRYGSYHVLYRLDGELIGLGVLDILPKAVSSVYFIWHPAYSGMALGKVAALREISLVTDLRRKGLAGMSHYMLGYYIHTCPKMRYKAEYQPCELLDPYTNIFVPWRACLPVLNSNARQSFLDARALPPMPRLSNGADEDVQMADSDNDTLDSDDSLETRVNPESENIMDSQMRDADDASDSMVDTVDSVTSDAEDDTPDLCWPKGNTIPGCLYPNDVAKSRNILSQICIVENRSLIPLILSGLWKSTAPELERILECTAAIGEDLATMIAYYMG